MHYPRRIGLAFALIAAPIAVPIAARAQIVRTEEPPAPARKDTVPTDPNKMLPADRARYEQGEFEAFRRKNLPGLGADLRRNCDEPIGRLCYRHDDTPVYPKEHSSVTARRLKMLGTLDSLARRLPGSLWITEQRVRYLMEADSLRAALALAEGCAAATSATWECAALTGLVRHVLGDYVSAERDFDRALDAMGPSARCRWRDISPLLDEVALAEYRAIRCGDARREAWEDRALALGRPLYSMKGNDARTEFYARRAMEHLLSDAVATYNFGFDTDEHDRLMRFGWARAWGGGFVLPFVVTLEDPSKRDGGNDAPGGPGSIFVPKGRGRGGTPVGSLPPGTKVPSNVPPRERPPDITGPRGLPGGLGGSPETRNNVPRIPDIKVRAREDDGINSVPFEAMPAFRYIPSAFVLGSPTRSDSVPWRDHQAPVVARYAPAYATKLTQLDHQAAVFRRGDSALVVMAYDATTVGGGARIDAGLIVTTASRDAYLEKGAVRESAPATGVLTTKAPMGPLLMSAEVLVPGRKVIARARYGIAGYRGAESRVTLSDLLFFKPGATSPTSAESAAPMALATERVRANEKFGVFWEAYGTSADGENLAVSLTVFRDDAAREAGVVGRVARVLSGNRETSPVRIAVTDQSDRGARITARALEVDISTLPTGRYIVQLEIGVTGQQPVLVERPLDVVRP